MLPAIATEIEGADLIAVVQDFDPLIQLHILADALVEALHAVRRTPKILGGVQNSAEQIHCSSLQKDLAYELCNLFTADGYFSCTSLTAQSGRILVINKQAASRQIHSLIACL